MPSLKTLVKQPLTLRGRKFHSEFIGAEVDPALMSEWPQGDSKHLGAFYFWWCMEKQSIYSLIPKIMSEVGAIEKSRQGSGISYKFRGIDDVYAALHGPLSKYGVFFAPKVLDIKREERQTRSGSAMTVTILTMAFTFYGPDGSHFETVTVGEAMDTSDKSANKAMSTALKYALFQVFCIPTEEDEKEKDTEYAHHEPTPKRTPDNTLRTQKPANSTAPSDKQIASLRDEIKKSNWSDADVIGYLDQIGVKKLADLTYFQYESMLEKVKLIKKASKNAQHA